MTTLYLVRHGETVDNAAQLMQGQTQGKLNDVGIRQAEEVRDRLKNEQIDVFLASDLYRSIQTCEIIAAPHQTKVMKTALLRERDWGDFTGKYIPDLKDLPFPENVETIEELKIRAQNFIMDVKTNYPNQVVLAVGHGIINKAIQSVLGNLPMNEVYRMENAEVRILNL